MTFRSVRFNVYLYGMLGLLLAAGCKSTHDKDDKDLSSIELHMEVPRDGASDNMLVTVGRESPFQVNVDTSAFLDTGELLEAKVVEDIGGFAIQLKFNDRGKMLLDTMTSTHPRKRIAVFCKFPGERWLGAPTIMHPMTSGEFKFTPDASRAETERIVSGLNKMAAKLKTKDQF